MTHKIQAMESKRSFNAKTNANLFVSFYFFVSNYEWQKISTFYFIF